MNPIKNSDRGVLFTKEHLLGWPISVLMVPDVHTYRKGTQSNLASERWLLLNVLLGMNIFLTCILDGFPEFVLIYITPGFSHNFIPLLYLTNHPFMYSHKICLMWFLILSLHWLSFSVLTTCIIIPFANWIFFRDQDFWQKKSTFFSQYLEPTMLPSFQTMKGKTKLWM